MTDKNLIKQAVQEWLDGKDYFLVDINVTPDNHIAVEIDNADGVWIEDCAELSRHIESRLNRDEEDYELEVGSAGIDKPFKVLQQYTCHIKQEVEVLTKQGQKLQGTLQSANNEAIQLSVKTKKKAEGTKRPRLTEETITLKYNEIKYTKPLIRFK